MISVMTDCLIPIPFAYYILYESDKIVAGMISLLEGELYFKVPLLLLALQQQVVHVHPASVKNQMIGLEF
jgi:hypothetical protein